MKVSTAPALNATPLGDRRLIALLTTLAALTAGMYALASTPAVAYQADLECTYDEPCEPNDGGVGGGDEGDAPDGVGGDEMDAPAEDPADQAGYDRLIDPPAPDPLVQLANDSWPPAPQPPNFEELQERQRAADRREQLLDRADKIRDDAFSAVRRFDPEWETWGDHNCDNRAFPLRCGVGWLYLQQGAECRAIAATDGNRHSAKVENCQRLEMQLWQTLQRVEELAEAEGYFPVPPRPKGPKATART